MREYKEGKDMEWSGCDLARLVNIFMNILTVGWFGKGWFYGKKFPYGFAG